MSVNKSTMWLEPGSHDDDRHHDGCYADANCEPTFEAASVEADTARPTLTVLKDELTQVEILARRWQELHALGDDVSLTEICSGHPELLNQVRAHLAEASLAETRHACYGADTDPVFGPECGFLSPPQGPAELGRLGGYRIVELVGTGAMGMVFRAEDEQLKRTVAVKLLRSGASERFLREAQTLAALEHEHVVSIYHVGQENGTFYLVMPFLKGRTLESRMRQRPRLTLEHVLRIGREIALGLAAAHERGIVHRDIKPSNIWLEGDGGRVKLLDFGMAHVKRDDGKITLQGTVLGTPAYMAPEQARGDDIDARADLFSLGCILYQLITGKSPFARKDVLSILRALEFDDPADPRTLVEDLPAPVAELILRLLAKDPGERLGSARDVAELLQGLQGLPPSADPVAGQAAARAFSASLAGQERLKTARPFAKSVALFFGVSLVMGLGASALLSNRAESVSEPVLEAWIGAAPGTRQDFGLHVEVDAGAMDSQGVYRFRPGQEIGLRVQCQQTAYLGVWSINAAGVCTQLFPNLIDDENVVNAGEVREIPGKQGYALEARPDTGVEALRVVASTAPWEKLLGHTAGHFQVFDKAQELQRLKQEFRGLEIVPARTQSNQALAECVLKYRVK